MTQTSERLTTRGANETRIQAKTRSGTVFIRDNSCDWWENRGQGLVSESAHESHEYAAAAGGVTRIPGEAGRRLRPMISFVIIRVIGGKIGNRPAFGPRITRIRCRSRQRHTNSDKDKKAAGISFVIIRAISGKIRGFIPRRTGGSPWLRPRTFCAGI